MTYSEEKYNALLAVCNSYKNDYDSAFERLKSQQQEIDRLKAENKELTKVVSSKVYDLIDNTKEIADAREVWEQQAKIEAVKDFAEELKAKTMCIKEYEDGIRILQTSNKLIDQSVKIFLDKLIKEVKE